MHRKAFESGGVDGQRRRWLALASATALGYAIPLGLRAQPAWRGNPFALGVASGSPAADSVVLWTRIAPQALPAEAGVGVAVEWELARDLAFARVMARGSTQALAELGWSVHVEPGALEPDTHYFYRFHCGGATSPVGRTRTLPASGAARELKLAYASCQKWEDGYFTAWRHMLHDQPDVVLFLGDYIYEYPGTSSKLRSPGGGWVFTLEQYRARYALYKSDADLQAMHAACPWVMTWDDHEVQNDYAGVNPGDGVPPGGWDAQGFMGRRAAAYQAYYENMPLRASVLTQAVAGLAQGAEMRIYGRLDWGRMASLYLLDTRQYKDAQACTKDGKLGSGLVSPGRCLAWADPQRSMLGLAQEQWLQAQWAQASSRGSVWNVLCQSTLLGQRDFAAEGAGQRLWNDGWDGYAAARQSADPGAADGTKWPTRWCWVVMCTKTGWAMCWPTTAIAPAPWWVWSFAAPASRPMRARKTAHSSSWRATRISSLPIRNTVATAWPTSARKRWRCNCVYSTM